MQSLWPGADQKRIYYLCLWGKLSTTCSNATEVAQWAIPSCSRPQQLRTMASDRDGGPGIDPTTFCIRGNRLAYSGYKEYTNIMGKVKRPTTFIMGKSKRPTIIWRQKLSNGVIEYLYIYREAIGGDKPRVLGNSNICKVKWPTAIFIKSIADKCIYIYIKINVHILVYINIKINVWETQNFKMSDGVFHGCLVKKYARKNNIPPHISFKTHVE